MPEETNQPLNDPFSLEGDAFAEQPLQQARGFEEHEHEEHGLGAPDDLYGAPSTQAGLPDMPDHRGSASAGGNRPASGARQVMPGEVLNTGFQGSDNAGDFLGLDVEFTGAQGALDLGSPPVAQDAPAARQQSGFMHDVHQEELPPAEAYDDGYAEDGYGDPFAEDEFGDGFEDPFAEEAPARRRTPLLVGGLLVAVLAAAGVTLAPRFLGEAPDGTPANGTRVAKAPTPSPQPDPVDLVEPSPDPGAVPSSDPGVDPFAASDPVAASEPAAVSGTTPDPVDVTPSTPDDVLGSFSADALQGLLDPTAVPARPSVRPSVAASVGISADDTELPSFAEGEFDWVSEDKLDMVWRGQNVPMDAIFAPARIVTPRVGSVRVHMHSGEILDGKLYAVGLSRVWLDLSPGRIGLDGEEVARFEHLAVPPEAESFKPTAAAPTKGDRVRVRTPGGLLYGRVISHEGDTLKLLRDDGGRVTLHGATVEPIGSGRAVVVQR